VSYTSRAYDKHTGDGFPPDPVVVLVVTGTHDVSRLVSLLNGGQPVVEQVALGQRIVRQVKRHNAGRAALELLRDHGGPDFTDDLDRDKSWNDAVDWLLNSRHTTDPDIQTAFWGLVDGKLTRDQAEDGVFQRDENGELIAPGGER
jgi:hypothetical protein